MFRRCTRSERRPVAYALRTHRAIEAGSWLDSLRAALAMRIKWFAIYRETYKELNALGDRDLADIGLTRHALDAISRQAAYDAVL